MSTKTKDKEFGVPWIKQLCQRPKSILLCKGVSRRNSFRHDITVLSLIEAFEFIDNRALHHSLAHSEISPPLKETYKFNLVIETSGSNTDHDVAKLQDYFEYLLEKGIISDGVLAENETQLKSLWSIREGVSEGLAHVGGGVYKYDFSISLECIYDIVEDTRRHLKGVDGVIDVVGYGHVGDGNLHLNIAVDKFTPEIEKVLEPWVYEWIRISPGDLT